MGLVQRITSLFTRRRREPVGTTEGEVDIVTEVPPAEAERVRRSEHARLVADNAMWAVAGVINRDAEGLPLRDRRARRALNLAVDRDRLVREAIFGHARPLAGLTPPTLLTALHRFPDRLAAYPHDANRAADLWCAAGGAGGRPLRIAAPDKLERVAHRTAADLREALGVGAEVILYGREGMCEVRRRLAERTVPREWDILLLEQTTQTGDAPTLELHRAFVGVSGEYRASPAVPEFEALWAELLRQASLVKQVWAQNRIDRFVRDEALALFARRRRCTRSTGRLSLRRTARRSSSPSAGWAGGTGRAGRTGGVASGARPPRSGRGAPRVRKGALGLVCRHGGHRRLEPRRGRPAGRCAD